ncbi:SDR family oxidoreductase [Nocardioides mangrovicus]|uniref:SDR family oxidoreductase n=1 Tax=Nocardioides mangrovicus TaxID=2478913 RepID=A0A3L8P308_9ACTN|nr:SDR family oxidoreductase [Nocardioides mangrovicus]RLV49233.1 SDR family oxidoreductase [Nocardioides mangrovicus]
MAYFVTGATGFIGRHLVRELVDHRDGQVFCLVREGSQQKIDVLARQLGTDRVVAVEGDLGAEGLGVDPAWVAEHAGSIDHLFHVAAIYDMTASDEMNEELNVGGTREALALAQALDVGCFHQVSSVAAAGDYEGTFDETMFDEGQRLPSPYHRTKFESEKLVRQQQAVPWRVYRPAIVVGHSETGEMDKVDGPYYFFGVLKRVRDVLPAWLPLVGVDLGDTNLVPVDYVAKAMDHLAHVPDLDGETFHLVNPEPQPLVEVVNTLSAAAGAPQFAVPVDRTTTQRLVPPGLLPRLLRPRTIVDQVLHSDLGRIALEQTIGRLGIPPAVVGHVTFPSVFASRRTEKALAGSGLSVPLLEGYASVLWAWWEDVLDDSVRSNRGAVEALSGKTVVITGASSGIGRVTAIKVAKVGGVPILVARGREKLEALRDLIESQHGEAYVYPCDLSDLDAIDSLTKQISEDFEHVDYVVNNAGRSIRRSLKLSEDRFHDFERTMQLNYFGAIRMVIGLLPRMREQHSGHIVNVSSIGVQTNPPRFSAYVASKSALDSWSNVVASELVGYGISFTSIHMPLVRTPMIAPTKLYDRFPTISPAQAAEKVLDALVDRPHEINTALGNLGAVAHTVAPKTAFRVLHLAYQVFPDSAAARNVEGRGADGVGKSQGEQIALAKLLRGIHW